MPGLVSPWHRGVRFVLPASDSGRSSGLNHGRAMGRGRVDALGRREQNLGHSMSRIAVRAFSIALVCAGMLQAQTARHDPRELAKIREQAMLVEEQLEMLRRVLPGELDAEWEIESFRKRVAHAELSPVEIHVLPGSTRLPLEDGRPSAVELYRIEISGRDPYQSVDRFLQMVRYHPRFARLNSLQLDAAHEDTTRFTMQFALAVFANDVASSVGATGDPVEAARAELQRKRALVHSLAGYLDPEQADVPASLALMQAGLEEHPVTLDEVTYDGELTLRGLFRGDRVRETLVSALERAGLRVTGEQIVPEGACRSFTLTARPEPGERAREIVLDNGIFEERVAAPCGAKSALPIARVVVGGEGPPTGRPHFLRLREVDIADVFAALSDLTLQAFVVDPDVKGRVSVDIPDSATIEGALAAIGSTGLTIGPGPLHRVSRTAGGRASEGFRSGQPGDLVSFSVKEARVSDVLCAIGEVAGTPIVAPDDLDSRISIFTDEVSLTDLRATVLAVSGLVVARETESSVILERREGGEGEASGVCGRPDAAFASRLRPLSGLPTQLSAGDIELVGIAVFGENTRAFVYGPSRHLTPLKAGHRFTDATVSEIRPGGIVLEIEGGRARTIDLPP